MAGLQANTPTPQALTVQGASRVLEVSYTDGKTFRIPFELMRVYSPSAEVQGHGPGQKVLVSGKRNVGIKAIEPMGNYGVLLRFDDGHDTGIFTWTLLHQLGREYDARWAAYTAALEAAYLTR